jgi:hypothetical protein
VDNGRCPGVKFTRMGKVVGGSEFFRCRIGCGRESGWVRSDWMCPGVKLGVVIKLGR